MQDTATLEKCHATIKVHILHIFFIFLFFYVVYCYGIKFNVEANLCVSGSTLRDQNALDLYRQAESCNAQCGEIWKDPVNPKVWLCCFIFHFRLFEVFIRF